MSSNIKEWKFVIMLTPLSKYIESIVNIDEMIQIKGFEMKWLNEMGC